MKLKIFFFVRVLSFNWHVSATVMYCILAGQFSLMRFIIRLIMMLKLCNFHKLYADYSFFFQGLDEFFKLVDAAAVEYET